MSEAKQQNPFDILSRIIEEQRETHASKLGWSLFNNDDMIWEKFYSQFEFTPSISSEDWPSIIEPNPSKTFDVKKVFSGDESETTQVLVKLAETYQRVFEASLDADESILALDWQHDCYLYNPHSGFNYTRYDDWPIEPYPNGDYYIFLTSDLTNGFFGHPWEKTICVFGEKFLKALNENNCSVLTEVCRLNGKSA